MSPWFSHKEDLQDAGIYFKWVAPACVGCPLWAGHHPLFWASPQVGDWAWEDAWVLGLQRKYQWAGKQVSNIQIERVSVLEWEDRESNKHLCGVKAGI